MCTNFTKRRIVFNFNWKQNHNLCFFTQLLLSISEIIRGNDAQRLQFKHFTAATILTSLPTFKHLMLLSFGGD
jgi:hypothetical protein